VVDAGTHRLDEPGVLVAQGEGQREREQPGVEVVHQVKVRMARARRRDAHHDLARPRFGIRNLPKLRRRLPGRQLKRSHRCPRMMMVVPGAAA
jgi:hypothetical protein